MLADAGLEDQRWVRPLPSQRRSFYGRKHTEPPVMNGLLVEWTVGGSRGGNCWDDTPSREYASDRKPGELLSLDAIFQGICPAISYLAFRRLEKLVKSGQRSEDEYYGNRTDYEFSYVSLRDLYDFLQEEKLLTDAVPYRSKNTGRDMWG